MGAMFAGDASTLFKVSIVAVFAAPAVVCLLIDTFLTRFRQWKWDLGIVFLSSAGFTLFCVVMTFIAFQMPAAQQKLKPGTLDKFEVLPGLLLILLIGVVGGVLVMVARNMKGEGAAGAK